MILYQHQIDGLERSKDQNHVAYYWDMGLGKTFVGSEKMIKLGANVNLIVCQKSKVNDWWIHMKKHYRNLYMMNGIFDLTNKCEFEMFMRFKDLNHGYTIGIINYDLIWRRKDLLNLKEFTLMLDESSLVQNETSKRSKFILKLQPSNVILLSGTPTGGKYEKLWSQMHLLGWNISKKLYWKQYVKVEYLDTVGRSIPIVTGYKNVDRLKRKMKQYGCQFLKTDEVFDLPLQNFQNIMIPTSKEYKVFKKSKIVELGDETLVGDTTLTRMLYERMLCSIYSDDKLRAFNDLVDSTDDRLIVFYNFKEELAQMEKIVERPISYVNGETKDLSAYEQKDDSITFIQYQSGAMGLNLQKANKIIYYSLPLSSELYEQSKKRIHRIGQEKPCFYYQLICKNSIEEKILKTLELRQDYTEKLFEKE